MEKGTVDQDRIDIRSSKGIWKRLIKIYPKCRLPWIWLAAFLVLQLGVIHIGLDETAYTAELFAGDTSAALLTKLIIVIIINVIGSSILIYVKNLTSARISRNMRIVLSEKVLRLPLSYFKDENPRDAVYNLVNKAIFVEASIMLFIIPTASCIYRMASVVTRIFNYDWRLSLVMLGIIPLNVLTAFLFGRVNYFLSKRDTQLNTRLTRKLAELITNIPLAKAFAKEDAETANGKELIDRLYKVNIKSSWLTQFRDISDALVSLIQSVAICLVGLALIGGSAITKRAWVSFFLFSGVFSNAVRELMAYWQNIKTIQGGADAICLVMEAKEENMEGAPCESLKGDIRIESLDFGYTEDKPVLKGLACEFPDNTVTALLGPSGCGKTTLTHLVNRLYEPDGGGISIGGRSIYDYALADYRRQFVVVSQNSLVFSGTIRENVLYGNKPVSDERIIDSLKAAGAYDFVMSMEGGLDAELDEYGSNLSGGQRQKLAMARALVSDAHYLILDEPVAAMDAIATAELMYALKSVVRDRCAIIISHTDAVLDIADRVVIIEDGALACEGGIAEAEEKSAFLKALIGKAAVV